MPPQIQFPSYGSVVAIGLFTFCVVSTCHVLPCSAMFLPEVMQESRNIETVSSVLQNFKGAVIFKWRAGRGEQDRVIFEKFSKFVVRFPLKKCHLVEVEVKCMTTRNSGMVQLISVIFVFKTKTSIEAP